MSTHGDHGEPGGKTQPLLFETHGANSPSGSNGVSKQVRPTADVSSDRLEPHPYSTLLGVRSPDEFRALAESMRQSGDAGEAVLYEGKVLWDPDRYRAAQMLGLKIRRSLIEATTRSRCCAPTTATTFTSTQAPARSP